MPFSDKVIEAVPSDQPLDGDEFEPIAYSVDDPSLHPSQGSAIYKHFFEHGRRYHYFRNGKYPMPNDELEQRREHFLHTLVLELTDGQHFHAPIPDGPFRAIDLGTGTGQWAIEAGEAHPQAEIVGVDLSPIQPVWSPPNVRFIIDDIDDDWLQEGYEKYDYVHARNLAPFLKNIEGVLSRAKENMKPGAWIEVSDFTTKIFSDDDTLPDNWIVSHFWKKLIEGMRNLGTNIGIAEETGEHLAKAGFINVQRKTYKAPVGTWPKDTTLRLVGMYTQSAIEDLLHALAVKPFQTVGMTPSEINEYMGKVFEGLHDRSVHSYHRYYVWTAQKPPST